MKKILISLLFLLSAVVCFGQNGWQKQNMGGPSIWVHSRGLIGADSALVYNTDFADTTTANIGIIDDVPGAVIRTGNLLWLRNSTATQWLQSGAGAVNVDTTQSILLFGDGSIGSKLTANLQISTQNGNILQLFPDGVYASTGVSVDCNNGLMSGGRIVFEQNLDYTVTPATYAIGCAPYQSVETLITLDAADPTFDRIDLIVVDTSNNVVVITGTPSDDPQNPSYDPLSQLPLSFILVTANAVEPAFCRDSIYYISNGETWTGVVSNTGRINTTSTNNPYSITEDVEFTAAQNNDQYRVTKSSTIAFATYSVLTFKIRSKATWATNSRVNIRVYSGLTPLGINVALGDGIFGFNSSITNAYQTIVIPLGNFGGGLSTGDNILFTISTTGGNTLGFYLDNIQLLGCEGTPVPVSGRFWSQGGDRWGTLGVIGTLDNFGMEHVVNNTNHTLLQVGGSTVMQGATPRLSFFLGTGAASDYFIERNGTTIRLNSAGDYAIRVAANTMYSIGSANGHLWNSSTATNLMQLNNTTGALRIFNYGDGTFTGTPTTYAAWDINGNFIEVSPPVTTVTADNGLSTNVTNNVQLGGSALLGNTSILTSPFTLTINSSDEDLAALEVSHTGLAGYGIFVTSSGDAAVGGANSTSGYGGSFSSVSGFGLQGISTSGVGVQALNENTLNPPLTSTSTTANTNTAVPLLQLISNSSGTAANGIGGFMYFTIEVANGSQATANKITSKWTDATFATRTSQFIISGINSSAENDILTLDGDGSAQLNDYGVGSFTGTPTFTLQVDASGNIIEGAVGAGTGDVIKVGTPVNNQVGVWTGDGTIEGDANLTFSSAALTIGVAGAATGTLNLTGSTSGTISIKGANAAGTYTLTLPTDDGNSGDVLSTDGSGVLSWIAAGSVGTVTNVTWTGGIVSIANPTTTPAFTIAGTSGGIPYFSGAATWASSAALAANAIVIGGGAGAAPSTTTTASGILTFLGTPSSVNLRTAVTDETGTGNLYFQSGDLGTPTAGTISTGVTLGDVTMNVTGTDATGDIYYRSAGGLLTRLGVGTNGQVLTLAAGLPSWATISGTGTMTSATITQPGAGITVTNSGVAQTTVATWTIALANDLAAVEGLATTGIVRRTGTSTWSAGTAVSLTTEVSGTLPATNGGTGFTGSTANGQLLIGNGTTWSRATLTGTSNQINVTNGSGTITLSMAFNPTEQTLSDAATTTWNVTNGGNAVWTNSGTNRTLTMSNVIAGYTYTLRIIQGAGGSHTVSTWTNMHWSGGTLPTLSTTAGAIDVVRIYAVSATNLYATFVNNIQ